jgi:type II secretory pathway component PulK
MMMALVTMFLLAIVAGEIVYNSGVFSSVVFRQRDQLQATLLARSGLRLALLQLRAAKKAKAKAKAMGLGDNVTMVDKIWQTPLVLPPPDVPGLSGIDKGAMDEFKKSLGLEGTVSVAIMGESGRKSINELVWPNSTSTSTSTNTATGTGGTGVSGGQLIGQTGGPAGQSAEEAHKAAMKASRDEFVKFFDSMLEQKRQSDDDFRNKYPNVTGEQITGNLLAWMDPNTQQDGNNRDKMDYYNRAQPYPYAPKNAPIASDSEYHMIEDLDETLAKLVRDNFTVQGTSSLDVNQASMLLIKASIPDLDQNCLDQIDKRRKSSDAGQGPFKDATDFWNFVGNTCGNSVADDAKKKFTGKLLDSDTTYHAVITAHLDSTNTSKTWLVDIGPMPPKDPLSTNTATTTAAGVQPQPSPGGGASTSTNTSTGLSTGTSDDDYDSLSIVYLKAE